MTLDSSQKADELIRLLGQLGQAQERGAAESDDLLNRAAVMHNELAQELVPQGS